MGGMQSTRHRQPGVESGTESVTGEDTREQTRTLEQLELPFLKSSSRHLEQFSSTHLEWETLQIQWHPVEENDEE